MQFRINSTVGGYLTQALQQGLPRLVGMPFGS
jgi:hypothetical protein